MKTLYIDIETTPNLADVWGLFNQTVSLSQLRASTRLLCFAYKWKGESPILFEAEWKDSDMLYEAWRRLEEADLVVTYNGDAFDLKTLNREFVVAGRKRPAPYLTLDLYKLVKKNFRFPSNKLQYVAGALGLGTKKDHAGHQMWVDVMNGDPGAQALMESYCKQDVLLTEALHSRLEGWLQEPNINLFSGSENQCPNCGSEHLLKRGLRYTQTGTYQRYQCDICSSWSQSIKRESGSSVKAI